MATRGSVLLSLISIKTTRHFSREKEILDSNIALKKIKILQQNREINYQ